MSRGAFTLVEILIVVALTGVIAVTAFTPLFHTVGVLRDLEEEYGEASGLRLASAQIARDLRQFRLPPRAPVVRLIRHDRLGGTADDVLIFWSGAPLLWGQTVGTVVYRLGAGEGWERALLRWVLPGTLPADVNPSTLEEEESQLVLEGIDGFRVALLNGGQWADEYGGVPPQGVRLTLVRGEAEAIYEDWLPTLP